MVVLFVVGLMVVGWWLGAGEVEPKHAKAADGLQGSGADLTPGLEIKLQRSTLQVSSVNVVKASEIELSALLIS